MEKPSQFFLYFTTLAVIFQALLTVQGISGISHESKSSADQFISQCPNNTDECFCELVDDTIQLGCKGALVTQEKINEFILQTHRVNNQFDKNSRLLNPLNRPILYGFIVYDTPLIELDIVQLQLLTTEVVHFQVWRNQNLTRIFSSTSTSPSIHAKSISVIKSQLTDVGLAETLGLFAPESLWSLNVDSNRIVGSQQNDVEFIPGLSRFTQLETLSFERNAVKVVAGGQFRGHGKLIILRLSGNALEKIEKDAFLIDYTNNNNLNSLDEVDERKLLIELDNCTLSDEKMSRHFCGGAEKSVFNIEMALYENRFEFLSEDKFRPFLLKNPKNVLSFDYGFSELSWIYGDFNITRPKSPFKCDDRMRWLKEGKAEFEHRVKNITCINDPGKTVFETNLV